MAGPNGSESGRDLPDRIRTSFILAVSEPIPIFSRHRSIAKADLDALDHVNNVVWVRFMIELADAHSSSVGLDAEAYRGLGGLWLVRRHEIDYHRAASLGDSIVEETWLEELVGAHCVRQTRFRNEQTGDLLVAGKTLWVWVDVSLQRPRRIPPAISDRFILVEDGS